MCIVKYIYPINCMREVLTEHNRNNIWLAQQFRKSETMVSIWAQNINQAPIAQLVEIPNVLGIGEKALLQMTLLR